MPFRLGPVFSYELLTRSRQVRYYWARAGLAVVLLGVISQGYQGQFPRSPDGWPTASIRQMADFGNYLFETLIGWQFAGVLLMTPAIVAGAVADEQQRKTLHYLLASCLSGAEIILGKLVARLLMMLVLITVGLPILSLLGLMGGVDPPQVAWGYAGTISTVLALAGISILVSVHARRVRDAIVLTYAIEAVFLLVPPFALAMKSDWPILVGIVEPVNPWLLILNPFWSFFQPIPTGFTGPRAIAWMLVLHGSIFLITTGLAMLRLRSHHRNDGTGFIRFRRRLGRPRTGRWAWFGRPECGNAPMLWKECHTAKFRGPMKAILNLLGLLILLAVGYETAQYGLKAWESLAASGYDPTQYSLDREECNIFIRIVSALLYTIAGLGIAVVSSISITSEKEEDTWTTLTSSTLSGRAILGAKMLGSVWSLRSLIALLLAVWVVGLITTSLHPVGFVLGVTQLVCDFGFIAALGIAISMRARTSGRSLATTLTILIFLNGGYLLCLFLVDLDSLLGIIGVTPVILGVSLLSFQDLWILLGWEGSSWLGSSSSNDRLEFIAVMLLGPLLSGAAGILLAWWSIRQFDFLIDRPRITR